LTTNRRDSRQKEHIMASWKPEVVADDTGKWYDNGLRFRTEDEAYRSASDLAGRWTLVRKWRATPSDDDPNYRISEDGVISALDS